MKIKRLSKFQLNKQGYCLIVSVCLMDNKIIYLAHDVGGNTIHTLHPLSNGILQLNCLPCIWHDPGQWLVSDKQTANVKTTPGHDGWKLYTIKQGLFNWN